MPQLSTHVLDAAAGSPAAGITVSLSDAQGAEIASAVTDAQGRAGLGPELLPTGQYTLRLETGPYFDGRGIDSFYPFIAVTFRVGDVSHYHVPILLSPFAFSTYRGS